ncbi:MAG: repeat-containing protein [Pedosphaera sp.]|nr:repeat-containing protein [Pedosphaera sp.]
MPTPDTKPSLPSRFRQRALKFLLILIVAVVATLVLASLRRRTEPTYQGISITHWMNRSQGGSHPGNDVVSAFGTNATPYLVKALQRTPNSVNKAAWFAWRLLPRSFQIKHYELSPVDILGNKATAAGWLMELGSDAGSAIPDLGRIALSNGDHLWRCNAVGALGGVGYESPEALSILTKLLKDKNVSIQDCTALALGRFGSNGTPAVRPLMEFVKNHPQGTPYNGILALGQIGPQATEAVPQLLSALRDPQLHGNALGALAGIGSNDEKLVPAMLELLQLPAHSEKVQAMQILMKIGPSASNAMPFLENLTTNRSGVIRILAATTIAQVKAKPESSLPVLLAELNAKGSADNVFLQVHLPPPQTFSIFGLNARETAILFLGDLGPAAQTAVPKLKQISQQPRAHDLDRLLAAQALWKIEHNPDSLLPAITNFLNKTTGTGSDAFPMHLAFSTLRDMGSSAKPAVPILVQFSNQTTNTWGARKTARDLLLQLGEAAPLKTKP